MKRASVDIEGKVFSFLEEGEGEPVLYVHGFPTAAHLWRDVISEVSKGFRCLACDLPGFGHSELLDGSHTWEALVDWLDEFVGAVGTGPVHLGVHDWGGLIGLAWAAKHPEKVASLLISDTSFSSRDSWHAAAQQWRTPGVGEDLIVGMRKEGFANLMSVVTTMSPETISEYWKGLDTRERRQAKLEMYRSLDFTMLAPLEPHLPKVAPGRVMIIWGENDVFVPPKTAFRLGDVLGAEPVIVPGASHFLQEDAGREVGKRHLEFLESL